MPFPTLLHVCCAIVLLHCAGRDIATRTIPDPCCGALLACGLLLHALDRSLAWAIAAGICVFVGAALLWRRGLMGGGDVKLLAACCCLVPVVDVPGLLAVTAISGAVLAVGYLVAMRRIGPPPAKGGRPAAALGRIARAEAWRVRRRAGIPYGVAICAGTLWQFAKG